MRTYHRAIADGHASKNACLSADPDVRANLHRRRDETFPVVWGARPYLVILVTDCDVSSNQCVLSDDHPLGCDDDRSRSNEAVRSARKGSLGHQQAVSFDLHAIADHKDSPLDYADVHSASQA